MNDPNKEEESDIAVKALINLIPGVGGALGSILNDKLAARKDARIKEFLEILKNDLEKNTKNINSNFVSKDDFLDLFELTANKISNERSGLKREAFKNILLRGILSTKYDFDQIEYQIKILDQLNAPHIELLKIFASPDDYTNDKSQQLIGGNFAAFFRAALPGWEHDYIFDHLRDLEVNRLIENVTGNFHTIMTSVSAENLKGQLTSKGLTFILFILT